MFCRYLTATHDEKLREVGHALPCGLSFGAFRISLLVVGRPTSWRLRWKVSSETLPTLGERLVGGWRCRRVELVR